MFTRLLALIVCVAFVSSHSLALAGEDGDDASQEMLKDPFSLKLLQGDSDLVLLDIRPAKAYAEGHVGGAVNVDLSTWKTKSLEKDGLRDAKFWGEAIGKLGIDDTKQVVVYGDELPDVARTWWLLKYAGIPHVGILDGGIKGWVAAKLPLSDVANDSEAVKFTPKFDAERLVEFDDLAEKRKDAKAKVIDTRSAAEHATHIPGAVNLEWKELIAADGKFKKPSEIKLLLQSKGLTPNNELITHCQTGGRASVSVFALELAGFPKVKNYYCGWSEYSKTKDAPVEKQTEKK